MLRLCPYAEALIKEMLISCAVRWGVGVIAQGLAIAKVGSAAGLWWQAHADCLLELRSGMTQVHPVQGPPNDHCPDG